MNKSVVCPVCNAIYLQDNLEDQICMECGFVNTPDNVIPANTLTHGQKINFSLDGYISGTNE